MNFLKKLQINETGLSNGLTIPSGFYISVKSIQIYENSAGFFMDVYSCTSVTDGGEQIKNDQVIDTYNISLTSSEARNTTASTLINNKFIDDYLESIYTPGNINDLT